VNGGQQPGGQQPRVQSAVVQRLTIRYAKRGRMRFASHRDVARAIERSVRKAGLPVAYSAGFSPHPKISYAGGAPTGTASEAEYLDISLTCRCEAAEVGRKLSAALPDGMDVIEVVEAPGSWVSTAARLEASGWEVVWPGVSPATARAVCEAFLAVPSAVVERLTNKGLRRMDVRAAVVSMQVDDDGDDPADARRGETGRAVTCAILRIIVRQVTPAVRPEDILTALRQAAAASGSELAPSAPARVTRVWQGPLDETPDGLAPANIKPTAVTDMEARLLTESAPEAHAAPTRANEQLPRGDAGQLAGPHAREPQGRDCPNARDRATQHPFRTVRT
jgi:radical SAM-linked protein